VIVLVPELMGEATRRGDRLDREAIFGAASLMIGWTAEHMELTDKDGRTNRLRYRWNRVRWANPNGHLAKAEPGNASPRAAGSAALCPVTCAVSVGKSARILNERRAGIRYSLSHRRGRAPWQASPPSPAGANGRGLPPANGRRPAALRRSAACDS
jgi:hypothetical protein